MNCTQLRYEANTGEKSLLDEQVQAELAQQVSNRQAAVAYLQAARLTDDAVARDLLRRRGVELLLRRPGSSPPSSRLRNRTKP